MSSRAPSGPVPAGAQSPDQPDAARFIVARTGHAPFYTDPRSSHGPHIEEELAAPEPEGEAD